MDGIERFMWLQTIANLLAFIFIFRLYRFNKMNVKTISDYLNTLFASKVIFEKYIEDQKPKVVEAEIK